MKNIEMWQVELLARVYNKALSPETADFMTSQLFKGVF